MYQNCRIYSLLVLLAFCLSFSGCIGRTGTQVKPKTKTFSSTPTGNPAGLWEGLIQHALDFSYVRLEIDPQTTTSNHQRTYTGRTYIQPFSDHLAGHDIKTDIKAQNIPITLNYVPSINSFSITPGRSSRYGINQLSASLRNLGGVHDTKHKVLTGLRSNQSYGRSQPNTGNQLFLFARPDKFKTISNKFKDLQPSRLRGQIATIGKWLTRLGGTSEDDIRKWAEKYYQVYPEADFYRMAHGNLELCALRLFRDEHFSRYFGKPFDELSKNSLGGTSNKLVKNFRSSRNRLDRSTSALGRMFWVGKGDNSAKQTAFWVIAQRHYLHWYHNQMDRLSSLPDGRNAFATIALLEAEFKKGEGILFWPEEIKTNKTQIAKTRKRLAYPVLETMIATWELQSPDFKLVQPLAEWNRTEQELFSYVDQQQQQSLLKRRNDKLHAVLDVLTQADVQSLQVLGTGLAAINAGNKWHQDAQKRYRPVISHPQVQTLLSAFYGVRQNHINQATPEMRDKLQSITQRRPSGYAPKNDRQRLNICSQLRTLEKQWFGLPNDTKNRAAQTIIKDIEKLGANVAGSLPPNLVQQSSFNPVYNSKTKTSLGRWKTRVPASITFNMGQSDLALKKTSYKPFADPGFRLKSLEVWAIFNGRFDLLDSRYSNQQGIASRLLAKTMNVNPQFHFAFVSWVGLSSQKYGRNQFGKMTSASWTTTRGDQVVRKDWGKVHMTKALFPYYERSYKIAYKTSRNDALFGRNGLEFINTILQFREGDWLGNTRVRPDGEVNFAAKWEKPILHDLKSLLDDWPAKSWGLWQFQENLQRFLEGKQSIQEFYNWS